MICGCEVRNSDRFMSTVEFDGVLGFSSIITAYTALSLKCARDITMDNSLGAIKVFIIPPVR